MKKHNFNAGPSILADEVLENAAKAIIDFNGSGLSLLSISHRTKDFDDVMAEADALFRETRGNAGKRRDEGCIAVDMECSGIQALCDFKGLEYYTFFYTGDLLDAPQWEQRILSNDLEKDHQLTNFLVALEIAVRVSKD